MNIILEETLHEIIEEESNELRLQLENQNNELIKLDEKNKKQHLYKIFFYINY